MSTDRMWWELAALLVAGVGLSRVLADAATPWILRVGIEPAEDRIEVQAEIEGLPAPHFYLHEDLAIHRITSRGQDIAFVRDDTSEVAPFTNHGRMVHLGTADPKDLMIEYGGALTGVESDVNTVGPELVELAHYAWWYPVVPDHPGFAFDLQVEIPTGFTTTNGGQRWTKCPACWGSQVSPDSCGSFTVRGRGGVTRGFLSSFYRSSLFRSSELTKA